MPRPLNDEIIHFILRSVRDGVQDVGSLTAKQFGVSRTTVGNYISRLVKQKHLEVSGNTKARTFKLVPFFQLSKMIPISRSTQEDVVWRDEMLPHMTGLRQEIIEICQYGFSEMLNNVIDHSESAQAAIILDRSYFTTTMYVRDYGVGIFEKITRDFDLLDPRHALLELSKGKLTSDPNNHTGEGIFFTSRMFSQFTLTSGTLAYVRELQDNDDWLVEVEERKDRRDGTIVKMEISNDAQWTPAEIFERYVDDNDRFMKTNVSINLARYEGEQLVSRSQARRILARVERFSEVILDFSGVPTVGQAFADEIFRVFRREHPDVHLYPIRASSEIIRMIHHAQANSEVPEAQQELPL